MPFDVVDSIGATAMVSLLFAIDLLAALPTFRLGRLCIHF